MENSVLCSSLLKFLNSLYQFLESRDKPGDTELIITIQKEANSLPLDSYQIEWSFVDPLVEYIYDKVDEPCLGMLLEAPINTKSTDPLFLNTQQIINSKYISAKDIRNNPPVVIAKFIQHYAQYFQSIIRVDFNVFSEEYRFTLTPLVENLSYNQLDTCLYGIHKWFSPYTKEKIVKLGFQHQTPDRNIDIYKKRFGITPEYGNERFEIWYSNTYSAKGDYDIYIELLSRLEKLLQTQSPERSMSSRCRDMIQILMPLGFANRESVCSIFNISLTTLKRTLTKEGVTYSDLLLEARQSHLNDYLAESDMRVSDVAKLLGYKEISQFSNAFMNWHGVRPSKYFVEL